MAEADNLLSVDNILDVDIVHFSCYPTVGILSGRRPYLFTLQRHFIARRKEPSTYNWSKSWKNEGLKYFFRNETASKAINPPRVK
jgi:hypothetical protein